jgi:hypothetical protein
MARMNRRTVLRAVVAALVALAVPAAGSSTNASSEFQLVFDGKHTPSLLHEGPFTTSAAFCPSGQAVDTGVDSATETALRKFTCAGSSGGFTARVGRLPAEDGGSGTWQIVEGSGPLADLRGKGIWSSVRLGGNPTDPATITFRSTWKGVADLDAAPPTVAAQKRSAQKLRRPKGAYRVRLVLTLNDAAGSAVDAGRCSRKHDRVRDNASTQTLKSVALLVSGRVGPRSVYGTVIVLRVTDPVADPSEG